MSASTKLSDSFYYVSENPMRCYIIKKTTREDVSENRSKDLKTKLEEFEESGGGSAVEEDIPPFPFHPWWYTPALLTEMDLTGEAFLAEQHAYAQKVEAEELSKVTLANGNNDSKLSFKEKLRIQIEFYFSPANLVNDIYLKSQMDANQFVPLSVLATFKKIQSMNADMATIVSALRDSTFLQLDEDGEKVRPGKAGSARNTIIIQDLAEAEGEETVREFLKNGPKWKNIQKKVNNSWYITFENEKDCLKAVGKIKESTKDRNKSISVRIKPNIPVILDSIPPSSKSPTENSNSSKLSTSSNSISDYQTNENKPEFSINNPSPEGYIFAKKFSNGTVHILDSALSTNNNQMAVTNLNVNLRNVYNHYEKEMSRSFVQGPELTRSKTNGAFDLGIVLGNQGYTAISVYKPDKDKKPEDGQQNKFVLKDFFQPRQESTHFKPIPVKPLNYGSNNLTPMTNSRTGKTFQSSGSVQQYNRNSHSPKQNYPNNNYGNGISHENNYGQIKPLSINTNSTASHTNGRMTSNHITNTTNPINTTMSGAFQHSKSRLSNEGMANVGTKKYNAVSKYANGSSLPKQSNNNNANGCNLSVLESTNYRRNSNGSGNGSHNYHRSSDNYKHDKNNYHDEGYTTKDNYYGRVPSMNPDQRMSYHRRSPNQLKEGFDQNYHLYYQKKQMQINQHYYQNAPYQHRKSPIPKIVREDYADEMHNPRYYYQNDEYVDVVQNDNSIEHINIKEEISRIVENQINNHTHLHDISSKMSSPTIEKVEEKLIDDVQVGKNEENSNVLLSDETKNKELKQVNSVAVIQDVPAVKEMRSSPVECIIQTKFSPPSSVKYNFNEGEFPTLCERDLKPDLASFSKRRLSKDTPTFTEMVSGSRKDSTNSSIDETSVKKSYAQLLK
uniref:HTH La-type RNA-binding domain-containing protein n=1 Tax=Rhabditophanes sp. KR3021 TaxID=114890 RepID=A0AC35U102_9BILA